MTDWFLVSLILASVVSLGLLFLPAIVELKKPRDSGPRLIVGLSGQSQSAIEKNSDDAADATKMGCEISRENDLALELLE